MHDGIEIGGAVSQGERCRVEGGTVGGGRKVEQWAGVGVGQWAGTEGDDGTEV